MIASICGGVFDGRRNTAHLIACVFYFRMGLTDPVGTLAQVLPIALQAPCAIRAIHAGHSLQFLISRHILVLLACLALSATPCFAGHSVLYCGQLNTFGKAPALPSPGSAGAKHFQG